MRKVLVLSAVGALLLALAALHTVQKPLLSKGHVPLNKTQLCHNGEVITVSQSAVQKHFDKHGDCVLPACDTANILQDGDPCLGGPAEGACNLEFERQNACGSTDACPADSACPDDPLFECT